MRRTPLSLEKMTYDVGSGTVIHRSKMRLVLKRNFQVMPGARWFELLCKHIPNNYQRLRKTGSPHSRSPREKGFCRAGDQLQTER